MLFARLFFFGSRERRSWPGVLQPLFRLRQVGTGRFERFGRRGETGLQQHVNVGEWDTAPIFLLCVKAQR